MGTSYDFEVTVGLHQGLALSPFLVVILVDFNNGYRRNILFADDVVLSETKEVEARLEKWRAAIEDRGMRVIRKKTVLIHGRP